MSNFEIGMWGIGVLFVLLLLRMPIAISLALVSVGGMAAIRGANAALGSLGTLPYDFAANWTLSAVPMFLLMGAFAFHSGMTASVYKVCRMWFWWVPGGLAVATNWASTAFGAVSGSSVAVTAVMSKIAIPEMLKYRYDKSLATSVVAASGTIDALIPPSIAFIIYSWYAEVPVTDLFMAGVVPGLLTAVLYTVMIVTRCTLNPSLGPRGEKDFTAAERRAANFDAWPLPVLFIGIFGTLYSGVMTSTEAAAGSAMLACLIAIVRGEMTWKVLRESLSESALTTASLFFIVIGAALFTRFMAVSGLPHELGKLITSWQPSVTTFMLIVTGTYIVLGMFLEGIGIMMLTLPILVPICRTLGLDLVWLGVVVVKLILLGLMHPPIGIQAFVVKGVVRDSVPLTTIFRGLLWFLGIELIILALLIIFPEISLWLPRLVRG
ncbi:TRAP transporter large permease [Noviherbaspirillum saxi]|uniref:TRAP transporter large permease protein n=1 Tax=Noviherbaspirillum saxi TaxID=2320863 RepID=A0A3A3FS91_9BURK|nr:TRAP transporter large permease [Noviherbaspirillum saxi]RJF98643.1 TRAP transporter large permease [Noviherbaspirillum saxi]